MVSRKGGTIVCGRRPGGNRAVRGRPGKQFPPLPRVAKRGVGVKPWSGDSLDTKQNGGPRRLVAARREG